MGEIKMVCAKEEFANMVARCHEKQYCSGCVLIDICGVSDECERLGAVARLTELTWLANPCLGGMPEPERRKAE